MRIYPFAYGLQPFFIATAAVIILQAQVADALTVSKISQSKPEIAKTYSNQELVYSDTEDHSKEISNYTKAILINPKDAEAYFKRGIAYYALKNYPRAILDYSNLI
jgi:tetratricopeptide (TPR) repeat protein